MSNISDIEWVCPECKTVNLSQIWAENDDPAEYLFNRVPTDIDFKYNEPCSGCGKYMLSIPTHISLVVKPIEDQSKNKLTNKEMLGLADEYIEKVEKNN